MNKFALRLLVSIMKAARHLSKEEHASINQLFLSAIGEKFSAAKTEKRLQERVTRADERKYREALAMVPDIPPIHDEDCLV